MVTGAVRRRVAFLACVGALLLLPQVAASATVANGGFETPAANGSTTFDAPLSLGGWTVDSGSLLLGDSSVWAPASGAQSIIFDTSRSSEPSLSQLIDVQPGRRYRLSLRHADGTPPPGPGYIPCSVVAGSAPIRVFWGDTRAAVVPGSGHLTDDWQSFKTLVTATAPSMRLRFSSLRADGASCGMALDDVALSDPSASETATSLTSSTNPSVSGQPMSFTATVISGDVSTVPTGTVQFAIDGSASGDPVALDAAGRATLDPGRIATGNHEIGAAYTPAPATSSEPSQAAPLTQTVAKAATVTSATVAPDPTIAGQVATFTATVAAQPPGAGTPTGTVQFTESDGTPFGAPRPLDGSGRATLDAASDAGEYQLKAVYSGDGAFEPSTGTASQRVRKADTRTTLTSSPNPVAPGEDVTFEAEVEVLPPGDVATYGSLQFTIGGSPFGPPIPLYGHTGVLVTVTAPTSPGSATIGLRYSGDENTNPSEDSLVQTVAPPSVTTTGTSPVGRPASPSPLPTSARSLETVAAQLRSQLRKSGLEGLRKAKLRFTAVEAGALDQRVFSAGAETAGVPTSAKKSLIASGRQRFASAGTGALRLRLTATGKRKIRRAKSLRLVIVTRFTPTTGAPISVTTRLKAKRRRAHVAAAAHGWRLTAVASTNGGGPCLSRCGDDSPMRTSWRRSRSSSR